MCFFVVVVLLHLVSCSFGCKFVQQTTERTLFIDKYLLYCYKKKKQQKLHHILLRLLFKNIHGTFSKTSSISLSAKACTASFLIIKRIELKLLWQKKKNNTTCTELKANTRVVQKHHDGDDYN